MMPSHLVPRGPPQRKGHGDYPPHVKTFNASQKVKEKNIEQIVFNDR